MSKFEFFMRDTSGRPVPIGPDNPLPMAMVSGSTATGTSRAADPVDDLPGNATAAQTRSTVNQLLAALRAAGVLATGEAEDGEPPETPPEPGDGD